MKIAPFRKMILLFSLLLPLSTQTLAAEVSQVEQFINDNKKLQWTCAAPGSAPFQIRVSKGQMEMFSMDGESYAFTYEIDPNSGLLIEPGNSEEGGFDVLSGKLGNEKEFLQCEPNLFNLDEIKKVLNSDKELQWVCNPPGQDPVKLSISEGNIQITNNVAKELYEYGYVLDPIFGWLVNPEQREGGIDILSGKVWTKEGVVECKANAAWAQACTDLCDGNWWYSKPEISISDIKAKLDAGEPINGEASEYKNPPLWFAAELDLVEIAEFLIHQGADLNVRDLVQGDTPLHLAVSNNSVEMIKALVTNGADILIVDANGDKPFERLDFDKFPEGSEINNLLTPVTKVKELLNNQEELQWVCNTKADGKSPSIQLIVSEGKMKLSNKEGESYEYAYEINPYGELIDPEYPEEGFDIILGRMGKGESAVQCQANVEWILACSNLCDEYWWYGEDDNGVSLDDVKAQVAAGDPVKGTNEELITPLHYAVWLGSAEIVEFLIREGANIEARSGKDDGGATPLHNTDFDRPFALEILNLLIDNGADINAVDNYGESLLYFASWSPLAIKTLVNLGADLHIRNTEGNTPLHAAVNYSDPDAIKTLVSLGANIAAENNTGYIPFGLLNIDKFPEGSEIYNLLSPVVKVKEVLVNNAGLQWVCSPPNETPFKLIVSDGQITMTSTDSTDGRESFSFPFKIDPDLGWLLNSESEELSGFDILSGKLWNEEEFLQCKTDIKNTTATASASNETLENSDECPSLCDFDWWSNSPSYEDVKAKILEGENIMGSASDTFGGHTPLHLAAAFGAPYMVEFFLSKGIDVEVSDSVGRTPLIYAANWGTADIMRLLIENGANVNNQSNENKETPLHWSIESKEKIELLLANGADVMARTVDGETPLHSAALLGSPEVVEILLANGADILAEFKDGNLPFYQVTENFKIDEGTPAYEALKPEPQIRKLIGTALEGQCKINEDANMGGPQKFNLTVTQEKMITSPEGSDEVMEFDYIVDQSTGRLANPESRGNQLSITSGFMFDDSEVIGQCDFSKTSSNETSCQDDPKACLDKDLCSIATKMDAGEKVWDMWGDGKNHSKEAKARGLSCQVGTLVESKDEQANLLKNADDAYEKGDFGLALQIYKDLAEKGNASAAYALGKMHYEGSGTLQNYQEAAKWMQLAADQGFGAASNDLGEMFEFGDGVLQDYQEAVKWYRLGAEQGNALAQYNLGTMYDRGVGVAENDQEAAWWYQLSATQGNADAQNGLGNLYYDGKGIPQNYQEALKWYLLGAEQGNALAQYNAGWMYDVGEGTPENDQEAAKWYHLSAEQGYAPAQDELGDMFYDGDGVNQNDEEALKWYQLAADQGNAASQFSVGLMYDVGRGGVAENDKEAARWYRLSAEQGFPPSQYLLADLYYNGLGVPQDYQEAFKWYQSAADQGYDDAQNELAKMFYDGIGVKQDYQQALRWYKAAADQGVAEAQYGLGRIYDLGKEVAEDDSEAVKWYKLSADQGYAEAQNALGNKYYWGKGIEKDLSLAVNFYQMSADQGNDKAQRNLGYMYEKGKGVPKDEKKAFEWYLLSAEQGNAAAQNSVGNKYYWGKGVEKNHQEAVKWYRLSADQGNNKAQRNLGYMYAKGKGVNKDEKEALRWYLLSAEQGNASAQNTVGNKYYSGKGTEKDYEEAVRWYRLAANQGNAWGQYNLARMYANGKGVPENDQEALKWYKLSADKGNSWAQNNLGNMYYGGEGVEKNFQEAIRWYRFAAEKKYSWGQYNLAKMYDNGHGVTEDNAEAVKWYTLAAKRGNSKAQYRLGLKYKEGSGIEQNDIYAHMWLNISSTKGYKEAPKALNEQENIMSAPAIINSLKLSGICKKSKYKKCSIQDL